jgi:hypothetical protein
MHKTNTGALRVKILMAAKAEVAPPHSTKQGQIQVGGEKFNGSHKSGERSKS